MNIIKNKYEPYRLFLYFIKNRGKMNTASDGFRERPVLAPKGQIIKRCFTMKLSGKRTDYRTQLWEA